MLDNRKTQILWYLLSQNQYVTLTQISNKFNVSKRTIQYDIKSIDDWLNNNNFPNLNKVPNKGIGLNLSQFGLINLKKSLNNQIDSYILSPTERHQIILFNILKADTPITMFKLGLLTDVSKTTIYNDLIEIEGWLKNFNLKLIRKKGQGVMISGNDDDFTKAINKLISTLSKEHYLVKLDNDITIHLATIKDYFPEIDLLYIKKEIDKVEKSLNITFSYEGFSNLITHIAMAIKRIKLKKDIYMPKDQLRQVIHTKEFTIAKLLAANLNKRYNITIPEDEIGFITFHLMGNTYSEATVKKDGSQKDKKLAGVVDKVITSVEKSLKTNISHDSILKENLYNHLKETIVRLKYSNNQTNPMLSEIKRKYHETFKACSKAANLINKSYQINFTEHEIAYLTMHFLAVLGRQRLEKNNNNSSTYNLEKVMKIITTYCSISDIDKLKSELKPYIKESCNQDYS
ncbi:transcription antiterminator [Proteinivorax tanatarense]|uniref:Transcription antiterminator n=1 Tax=Proteinivorax tanatarense TaxID=1260629 RepID=A0AAU7VKR5_9FIRM